MRRWLDAPATRPHAVLALVMGAPLAVLVPSLLAASADPGSTLLAAALMVAVAALVGLDGQASSSAPTVAAAHVGARDEGLPCPAGGVTDPPRHPLRPRAPGLV